VCAANATLGAQLTAHQPLVILACSQGMGGGNTDGGMCGGTNGGTGVTKATRHRGDGGSVLGAFFLGACAGCECIDQHHRLQTCHFVHAKPGPFSVPVHAAVNTANAAWCTRLMGPSRTCCFEFKLVITTINSVQRPFWGSPGDCFPLELFPQFMVPTNVVHHTHEHRGTGATCTQHLGAGAGA